MPARTWRRLPSLCLLAAAGAGSVARAQQSPEMQQVLQRLDRLEEQNRELLNEIQALRQQLTAKPATAEPAALEAAATPAEQVEVNATRIAQLDQEKISSDHRLPVSLTGMLLFNSFWTGHGAAGADNPTIAPLVPGAASGGAIFRQSVVGIKFDGPEIAGGGKIGGSAYIDFFAGTGGLNQLLRLRVASVEARWKYTTVSVALDKPILAPREPDSLAQVGVSPLTAAGNLWLWQPQVRVEQRVPFGSSAGMRAQFGVYQTSEGGTGLSTEYPDLSRSRPGYQGRFEFWADQGESRRIEIAPGFHVSSTRVLRQSAPSRIFSVDWLIRPMARIDLTGTFFAGENTGVIGGLRQGVNVLNGSLVSVGAIGGWAQFKYRFTNRLSVNLYGGQEDDRDRDLDSGNIGKNQAYAANVMYRFGSNVLTSFEASQVRTTYVHVGTRLFPHYDLALAYLF